MLALVGNTIPVSTSEAIQPRKDFKLVRGLNKDFKLVVLRLRGGGLITERIHLKKSLQFGEGIQPRKDFSLVKGGNL